ncbi:lactate racemase domain-containing protein [uncultured Propionibacterium sp.]|uniref:lactate racemase domain-containing protein n=1 Tax=uncultured Propionibacterium sp. TaxID=218066 RepID=UPI0029319C87|nr:lactate racemase domain-containing protein [uncultured Propionibacterium sp.]
MGCQTIGGAGCTIGPEELDGFLSEQLAGLDVDGRSVALVIPDDTRSCPLPRLLRIVHRSLVGRVRELVCVIALGTHEYMGPARIAEWTTGDPGADLAEAFPGMEIVNHEWRDPSALVRVGRIGDERMAELSGGRLSEGSDVLVNRRVAEADVKLVIGPVLPHEVVGMSGGNKYFIPGVAQEGFISRTHWVGALITSSHIIGAPAVTPVRAMIDEGAAMVPGERYCIAFVVRSHTTELESVSIGTPEDAWHAQARIGARTHVEYVDEPMPTVLSLIPDRYHDIWTAAKGFYKTEPAVAAGGEVIVYAPHITEVSQVHAEIYEIGYHCRDYFVKQWDRFKQVPWGVLAHSTHLRGLGSYDPRTGVEADRVRVSLATGIPREVCESINLGYYDPATIDPGEWAGRDGVTVVPDAGEVLYRLHSGGIDGADGPFPVTSGRPV